jgi:hypothetical protein
MRVEMYIRETHLPVWCLKRDCGFKKKGRILSQATTLWMTYEQYKNAAVEDRYHPYPGKSMKQNVPCIIAHICYRESEYGTEVPGAYPPQQESVCAEAHPCAYWQP